MKQYALSCRCGRSETHGTEPPDMSRLQTCLTARAIRGKCRDVGCYFEVVETEQDLTDVDQLRLGLREDRIQVVEVNLDT